MNSRWFIGLSVKVVLEVIAPLMRVGQYLGGVTQSTPVPETQCLGFRGKLLYRAGND